MKKISYFLAVLCLLASASQMSAQLINRSLRNYNAPRWI